MAAAAHHSSSLASRSLARVTRVNLPYPCAALLCIVFYSQSAAPSALMYGKTNTWGGFLASNNGERASPLAVLRDLRWSWPAAAVGWAGGNISSGAALVHR